MYKPAITDLMKFDLAEGAESKQNCQNEEQSLDVQHYCTFMDNKINVLWELKPVEAPPSPLHHYFHEQKRAPPSQPRMPGRVVCVVDVSHSMAAPLSPPAADDTQCCLTKLDRIRLFAQLLVRITRAEDSLGFVTFGTRAKVVCQLQKMTPSAKEQALQAIDNISLGGVTNISAGLSTAIELFRADFKRSRFFDDTILLFADGMANDGVTDVATLVDETRDQIACVRRECHFRRHYDVRVVTVGTAGFLPDMLAALGEQFSSDAFHRLDDSAPLEVGLVRPLLLRHTAVVTHATVTLEALNGVQLDPGQLAGELAGGWRDGQSDSSSTTAVFDLHDVCAGLRRHLNCRLLIGAKCGKLLRKQNLDVLAITVRYLDAQFVTRTVRKTVAFESLVCREKDNNLSRDVIEAAKDGSRVAAWRGLRAAAARMERLDRAGAHDVLQRAAETIRATGRLLADTLRVPDEAQDAWLAYAEPILFNLEHYDRLLADFALKWDDACCRLVALASALARETPAAAGVYANGVDLFGSPQLDEKVHEVCYDLKSIYVAMGLPSQFIEEYQHALVASGARGPDDDDTDVVLYS